jgi:hypothetical protein
VLDAQVPVVLLGPCATPYVETRVVVPCRNGVVHEASLLWALDRVRSRPGRQLHLLDTWIEPTALGVAGPHEVEVARTAAQAHHAEAMAKIAEIAARVSLTGELVEGRAIDVEAVRCLPGDLMVVTAEDATTRPALTRTRGPVVIVPVHRPIAASTRTPPPQPVEASDVLV